VDTYTMRHSDRYRAIASELRLIAPKMKLAKAAEELRLMAITYERLAEHHEAVSYPADED
jgi:hypothetical protein